MRKIQVDSVYVAAALLSTSDGEIRLGNISWPHGTKRRAVFELLVPCHYQRTCQRVIEGFDDGTVIVNLKDFLHAMRTVKRALYMSKEEEEKKEA